MYTGLKNIYLFPAGSINFLDLLHFEIDITLIG